MRQLEMAAAVAPAEDLAALAAQINADHEAGEGAARQGLEHFRAAGEKLVQAKRRCGHGRWLKWLEANVRFSQTAASAYMRVARNWDKLAAAANLRDALRMLTEDAADEPDAPAPEYVTLDAWGGMSAAERKRCLQPAASDKKFNGQGDNENIEWALWSWNPVTGCRHDCPYCYARDIAQRFYDQKFEPSLWPGRLWAPRNTPFPEARATEWMGHKNVFTCSMADLFGRWVPQEWIEVVLSVVRDAPQWNFLFLTKFPQRMAEFSFPANAWVGTSVDCQARVSNAERAFRRIEAGVKWLSCEPLIEPLVFSDLGAFDWVVLGGASASSRTPEWHPPRAWVNAIEAEAKRAGVKVYEKSNLLARIKEYPGLDTAAVEQAPEPLRYLPEAKH